MKGISAVISIKTGFADLILEGTKRKELRKSRLPVNQVDRFFIYSSGKEKMVVGSCNFIYAYRHTYFPVFEDELQALCITKEECDAYLNGSDPFIYDIACVERLKEPLTLAHFGLTHAPQSWAYAKCMPASILSGGV